MHRPDEAYEGKTTILDADTQEVLARELREDAAATTYLLQAVQKGGEIDLRLAHAILYSKEHRLAPICERLGIELNSVAERENRYADLRAANIKVRRLERELGETGTPKQTAAHLSVLAAKLNYWWDVEGFGHVSEMAFNQYGALRATFSCHLFGSRPLTGSRTPVSDREAFAQWTQELKDRGFELVTLRGEREPSLLDSDANRTLLVSLIATALPSARISATTNHCSRQAGQTVWTLKDLSVYIHDLEDVQALPDKPGDED